MANRDTRRDARHLRPSEVVCLERPVIAAHDDEPVFEHCHVFGIRIGRQVLRIESARGSIRVIAKMVRTVFDEPNKRRTFRRIAIHIVGLGLVKQRHRIRRWAPRMLLALVPLIDEERHRNRRFAHTRCTELIGPTNRCAVAAMLRVDVGVNANAIAIGDPRPALQHALTCGTHFAGSANRRAVTAMLRIDLRIDARTIAIRRSRTALQHALACGTHFARAANRHTVTAMLWIDLRIDARTIAIRRSRTALNYALA